MEVQGLIESPVSLRFWPALKREARTRAYAAAKRGR